MQAAAGSLRDQADFAQKVARGLQSDSEGLREHAQRNAREADEVNAAVSGSGPQPATPPPGEPQPPGELGRELVPGPSPEAPVTQHASVDKESDPATAAVAGGDGAVRERGTEGGDAAGEQTVGVLDASSDPLPFDNSDVFADAFADTTTFANTG